MKNMVQVDLDIECELVEAVMRAELKVLMQELKNDVARLHRLAKENNGLEPYQQHDLQDYERFLLAAMTLYEYYKDPNDAD